MTGFGGWNDAIAGWRFSATMQRRTPLEWLLEHGREAPEPQDVPQHHGIWIPMTKTFRDLCIYLDELPLATMASEVGQIPQDGGNFLPFLIAYRNVVENGEGDFETLKEMFPGFAHLCQPIR